MFPKEGNPSCSTRAAAAFAALCVTAHRQIVLSLQDHRSHLNWTPWVWQEGHSTTFSCSMLTGELINPINLLKLNKQHGAGGEEVSVGCHCLWGGRERFPVTLWCSSFTGKLSDWALPCSRSRATGSVTTTASQATQRVSNAQIYHPSQLPRNDNKSVQSAPLISHILAWIFIKWSPEHWQHLTNLFTKCSVNTAVSRHQMNHFSSASPALFQGCSVLRAINSRSNWAGWMVL